jgi:Tfp pilus assembly protein PilO
MQIDRPIAIAIILFIVVVLSFFLVVPEYKNFKQLQVQFVETKAEYDAQNTYYVDITKVYEELYARREEISKIDNALPLDPPLGKLIYYLQQTGKDNGLIVKDLFLSKSSLLEQSKDSPLTIKEIVFSTDVLGNYQSLKNFIVSLEKSSRIFEVSNISFGSEEGSLLQNYSLQIKTFSY